MKKQKFNKVIVASIIIALVMSMMFEGSYVKAKVTSIEITEAWNLVWSDEFNGEIGSAPDEQTWNYDVGATGWGNNEIQNYRKSTDNVYIADISQENILSDDNKALAIKLKKESDGKYTSGRIHTLKKQYFKYGRVEAKLKVENGSQSAVWPAFWMMGNNYDPSSSNYDGSKGTSHGLHVVKSI